MKKQLTKEERLELLIQEVQDKIADGWVIDAVSKEEYVAMDYNRTQRIVLQIELVK